MEKIKQTQTHTKTKQQTLIAMQCCPLWTALLVGCRNFGDMPSTAGGFEVCLGGDKPPCWKPVVQKS